MNMEDICETGPMVYCPYPRRLESLTICGCNYKGSTFSPQLFKDPEVWSGRSLTHHLPHGSPVLNLLSQKGKRRKRETKKTEPKNMVVTEK